MPPQFYQSSFKFRPEPSVKKFNQLPKNNSGFMTAEFLFAFTMVIGSGILIFALTFALTTVEIAQYIVWSAARAHAVGNKTVLDSVKSGETKYTNLTAAFPLLTGNGSDSPWFNMPTVQDRSEFFVGDISDMIKRKDSAIDKDNASEPGGEARHPWIGVESSINLKLLSGITIPFLGKITETPEEFKFPIRGVLFRHPSYDECQNFFKAKFAQGISKMPNEPAWTNSPLNTGDTRTANKFSPMEDNGC